MRKEISRRFQTALFPLRDRYAKLFCIPVNNYGGEKVEPCDPKVLAFCGSLSDFSLPTNPQCIL